MRTYIRVILRLTSSFEWSTGASSELPDACCTPSSSRRASAVLVMAAMESRIGATTGVNCYSMARGSNTVLLFVHYYYLVVSLSHSCHHFLGATRDLSVHKQNPYTWHSTHNYVIESRLLNHKQRLTFLDVISHPTQI